MFERFSDRARRVLVLAQEEARLLGESSIGTEHLLLGLIHDGEGPAAQVLESSGVSLEAVRAKVSETPRSTGVGPQGSPPFSPAAKKALELALREARGLGHDTIGAGHVFLGLLHEQDGVAVRTLRSLGAGVSRLREQVIERLNGGPVEGHPTATGDATARTVAVPRPRRVGSSWRVEVVRAGRGPEDAAAAYGELARLLSRIGVDFETLRQDEVTVDAVDTDQGPGLLLTVVRDVDGGGAEEGGDAAEPAPGA